MTILSPSALKNGPGEFEDNQPPGSVTPADIRTMVDSLAGLINSVKTTSYVAVLADAGTCIEMNSATAVTFTLPGNATVAYDIGTVMEVCQLGAGQVTITPSSGVTLRSQTGSLTTRTQYSSVSLRKRAADEWVVSGDLT